MKHGGDIYGKTIAYDFSVSLNPFPPKEEVRNAGILGLEESGLYPDLSQRHIREVLASLEGADAECILAGNGASELLLGAVRYLKPKKTVLFTPCYSGYEYALKSSGKSEVIRFALKEETGFLPTSAEVREAIGTYSPNLIILTNPWNPTGRNFDGDELKLILKLAKDKGVQVILDESFLLLSESALEGYTKAGELIRFFPNVIVLKSFTKFLALPGVRMGYLVAEKKATKGIRALLPEWNLSHVAEVIMEAGAKMAQDETYMKETLSAIRREREYLTSELTALGLKITESDSCYLFVRCPEGVNPGAKLLDEGVMIRTYDKDDYPGENYCRIGIKDREANAYLAEKLKEILHG